ncbi:MAG: UDP-N-acetylmuramoyl-tripeptide--D-alanyl-D-alanine ligase [Acidimicrobiaceae bacterium]|nr:UDP-N-acetylmuramoyl-tripeptide--D-alanyl-D-alanine ligase [Acidimicrobiaceae bacterium]MCY4280796.1 UDP-N-acetylmuramoyl-tripeptide--D-alanyl-D-alanine ligase [Acidimicrobiaceae bacterium]MCY4295241.1 UDP-N-acetylmuramoyl-tripeptide--D-alanyl-D-alanine ligase [Acidimicrobiaceae bacterium]
MRWSLREVAAATAGRLHGDGDQQIDGVVHDSREAKPLTLFVPLVAQRDGHDFIGDAVRSGACAYLTSRGRHEAPAAAIEVADTQTALTALACRARDRLEALPVVGVTGSVGKTTTKDLLAAVLRQKFRVWASTRSFNNEIGVPLTLLSAPADSEALVVEMGARGAGHIAELCRVARPTMGVVTTVGLAHTSELGSLRAVTAAKRELVEALAADADGGVAFLNAGVAEVMSMARHSNARVVTFGTGGDVSARDLAVDADLVPRFVLRSPSGETTVRLNAAGTHFVDNALAAAAVALELGVSLDDVAEGLAAAELSPLRMELRRVGDGAVLINDSYNANPLSMSAALRALAAHPARRKIAVLGPMAELGDFETSEHAAVGAAAAQLGVEVIAADAPGYAAGGSVILVDGVDSAFAALQEIGGLDAECVVLIKGSRVAGLERLAARIVKGADC